MSDMKTVSNKCDQFKVETQEKGCAYSDYILMNIFMFVMV